MDCLLYTSIFRIVQESITNALRHGRAKKVEINIYQRVSDLEIVIADNGVGCDDLKLGYGLKQMQERAAILNGRLEYYSNCLLYTSYRCKW